MKIQSSVFLTLLILFSLTGCLDGNRAYVRKAVSIMDKQGIFATGAEWDVAKHVALEAVPENLDDAREFVRNVGKFAGGKHTFLKTESEVTEDATSTDWEMPSVSIESDGIAVIKLPSFSGNHDEGIRYAKTVLDAVPDDIKGAVIDLRDNRGGNMYPMIAAVHRFIADDDILRFRTRKRTQWILLTYVVQGTGVEQMSRIECPVAILTNEWTASSGEVFCDDPIDPDVLTDTPLDDAIEWIITK